ncbi:MAG6790 family protein [Mesomycoplasma lagogenitalium]|uniref:Uncharacterized protein n=1 Tax=Mesomycoplasma lagogenitalium TaxID=171286 RepID=A0ABY8LSP6_9BACT|nr:hypothetical protein [Mesomycoplasma lagogenitalium]WGI36279.1 hypothetical protein QEG99_02250 [Mesomycoplasma lagogenitalium]
MKEGKNMYQYKAVLKSNKKVIAQGHSLEDIEKDIKHFIRQQKKGIHTESNVPIEIYHIYRDKTSGSETSKEKLVKII